MLKEIQNHIEIEEFGKYKVDLIKEHQYYANKLGLYETHRDDTYVYMETRGGIYLK